MLFSELYGSYFNVVAKVLELAVEGDLSEKDINAIISRKAFGESILNIPATLKNENWKLLDSKRKTPIKSIPTMPLTLLQKQWLKALLNDPRIKLFAPSVEGLDDVEPLYEQETIEYFDRYSDGDDFEDPEYIENFQIVLEALKTKRKLRVRFKGHRGQRIHWICIPYRLEYSSKDDKFRLIGIKNTGDKSSPVIINLGRVKNCKLLDAYTDDEFEIPVQNMETLVIELVDERKALERVMLHFSHLEKEATRIDDNHYRITLKYDKDDEAEILIRILSFGPMIKVVSPSSFIDSIKKRIDKQESCEI